MTATWKESDDIFRPTPVPLGQMLAVIFRTHRKANSTVVLVSDAVMAEIFWQLKSKGDVEMGGVLVGNAFVDSDMLLHVVAVRRGLLGDNGEGTPVSFKFTSDSWQSINSKLLGLPAEERNIVGWYHSHPGVKFLTPSSIDDRTMRSWIKATNKKLLCGIFCQDEQRCYCYYKMGMNAARESVIWVKPVKAVLSGPVLLGICSKKSIRTAN